MMTHLMERQRRRGRCEGAARPAQLHADLQRRPPRQPRASVHQVALQPAAQCLDAVRRLRVAAQWYDDVMWRTIQRLLRQIMVRGEVSTAAAPVRLLPW